MKQKILFLSFLLGASSLLFSQSKKDIVDYVNPVSYTHLTLPTNSRV